MEDQFSMMKIIIERGEMSGLLTLENWTFLMYLLQPRVFYD